MIGDNMNAQITSGRGDRFIVIDTETNSIVTNAVVLFPYQDKFAYESLIHYAKIFSGISNQFIAMMEELDKIWSEK